MSMIIGFLTSKLGGPIMGVLAAILAVALLFSWVSGKATEGVLRGELKTANAALDQSRGDLSTCRTNTATLQASLTDQNAKVDALKAAGDVATANADAALAEAKAGREKASQTVAAILAAKPATADLCKAADTILTPGAVQ
jgi:hypothetical protein